MKTIMKSTITLALLLCISIGFASEPQLRVNGSKEDTSLEFTMEAGEGVTAIRFLDMEGNLIYDEELAENRAYGKVFELRELKKGLYFLEVEDAFKKITYTVNVDGEDSRIIRKTEKSKPVFTTKGKKVYLNLLNLNSGDVKIKIYDSSERVVYEETVKETLLVEKAFNFESAFEDRYTVVVTDTSATYFENVLID